MVVRKAPWSRLVQVLPASASSALVPGLYADLLIHIASLAIT